MSVSGSSRGRKSQKTCETISVDELGSLLTEGKARHVQVIDVREIDFYSGFIPSSHHVPFDAFDRHVEELCQQFARCRKLIVFHDMSPEDFRARHCAKVFEERLFDLFPSSPSCVCVLKGGFESWKRAYGWKPDASHYVSMQFSFDWDDTERSDPVSILENHPFKPKFGSHSSAGDAEEPQSPQLLNAAQRSASMFLEQMFDQRRSFDTMSWSGSDADVRSSASGAAKADPRPKSGRLAKHQQGYAKACADGTLPQHAHASTDFTVGSLLQIYSNSQAKWIPARVVATSSGRVKALYQASETSFMTKVLPRQSGSLRPLERCNSEEARILMNMNILTMSSMVELEYISQEELVACFQRPDIQLIDVREEHEYFTGHILGARHCPHHRFDKELRGLAHEFAYSDKTLVFYGCDSEDFAFDCARRCLAHLRSRFFRRTCEVRALLGGFEDWLASCKHPGLRSMRVSLGRDRPHTCSPFSTEESLANWSDILRATRTDQSLPNLIDDNEGEDELDDERTPDVQKRNKHAFSFVPKARNR
eukprot:gnl/TRDRNA2_/TRDRNA2_176897_c1_seq2.p1 gnl/TRDRNA2_/TRDRNA2_176897_c1~~gnl/TRDRNA2_/TRDRNA2_176897_c1_seq2.p1  ORF type:complete len:536 (+),score=61.72 gnl/TRDRNA2_/TRDRNA2_176897_c1_seq2:109-1716(+)